ncbi:Peptidyl-prolyl cis-trans isomerase [Macleaya cordata]|uniref:Peptidyl-prolyl cis-trans isomerase n=1 Tax=Macleaya cordata TaxID=56857 RepID=A0A200R761_MACCD|nr:Peptidyl-prolyl cis-trans isomerase [Macleaya cordata]
MWSSRACHLPNSLKLSSPNFLCNLNLNNNFFSSSSLTFSSSSQLKPASTPSLSRPIFTSSSISFSPPSLFNYPLSFRRTTLPKRKDMHSPKGRASCSSGSIGRVGEGREILVQHLLVKGDNLKLLLELQERIARGEDLSDLAVEYSNCPSKEQGGMLGWVRKGQMVPEFEEAAFSAPLNKVVRCQTKFGWHLLQVLSEREEALLQDVEPEEFHLKMQDPSFQEEVQLLDVREPEEVTQASLPGFQVLPLRQFGSWGTEITTKLDTEKDTYVLCHHGVRSLQVAKWLQAQGFKRVFNISGGIHAYAVKVDPSIPTY